MRTALSPIAILAVAFALHASASHHAVGQETIVMDNDVVVEGAMNGPGTGDIQSPPWHGNVCGDPCGPCCPPPNVFHADPRGQLHMKHNAGHHCHVLPPCFPRMHGRLTTGWWPTPKPISLPRCPRCGAHIEGGF